MWEQAWTTLMEQRFTVLNVILISLTQVVIMVLTLNEVLKRRHSMNWIISYCMIKVLIMDVFFNILLNTYLEQHFELNIIVIFFKMAVAILNLTVIWLIYEGDIIKCAFCGVVTEIFTALIGGISISLTGVMKNGNLSSVTWRILAFILLCFLIFFAIRFLIHCFWKGSFPILGEYELKHKKFWCGVYFLYISVGFYQLTIKDQTRVESTYRMSALTAAITAIGFIGLSIWIYRKYQDQIRQEHAFLNIKQNLMVLHMKAVRQQILGMENEQRVIDQQMENIRKMEDLEGTVQIEKYLRTLKNQYQKIQAGVYTDDIFVDSVLYYYADMMRRKNLELEISFAKYQRDSLNEMCAGKILMCLMETALTNDLEEGQEHKIKLYGGTVKNQVIFRLECGTPARKRRRDKRVMKTLKDCIRQYEGSMEIEKKDDWLEMKILLAKKGQS